MHLYYFFIHTSPQTKNMGYAITNVNIKIDEYSGLMRFSVCTEWKSNARLSIQICSRTASFSEYNNKHVIVDENVNACTQFLHAHVRP